MYFCKEHCDMGVRTFPQSCLYMPRTTPAVTRDCGAELLAVTLIGLRLQSDWYICGCMICHSTVNFTTVMFTPSDRKNGLPTLISAFYVVKL
jgi:hypothetical protein